MLRLLWKRGLKIDFVYPFLLLSFLAPFFGHSWVLFEELNMLSVSKKTFHKSSIFVWIISITTLISPVFYLVVLLVHNNQNGAQFQEYLCNSKVLFGCQKGDCLHTTTNIFFHWNAYFTWTDFYGWKFLELERRGGLWRKNIWQLIIWRKEML